MPFYNKFFTFKAVLDEITFDYSKKKKKKFGNFMVHSPQFRQKPIFIILLNWGRKSIKGKRLF